jgi:hypothetical protein
VYLARHQWANLPVGIKCRLDLRPTEVLTSFAHFGGEGDTVMDLTMYLQEHGVPGLSAGPGSSSNNLRIQQMFLDQGICAIRFHEQHGQTQLSRDLDFGPDALALAPPRDTHHGHGVASGQHPQVEATPEVPRRGQRPGQRDPVAVRHG